ncbi:LysR family transcriptional regulator [Shewanella sp. FJAT-52076]|uniref:LysR family transcriptional regulator n=1 Tax=Shewanella sp. FJAT-52076 TaxID=2864202 RepID=UPI0021AC683C|nr:LysR family transcriptional regulator [Shewanella sp. FJAT-52076]
MLTTDLALFVRVAEAGSISAAAAELDMTPASASAAIKRLEKQLGSALFIRTTRSLRLSQAGERYLGHCHEALSALELGRMALSSERGTVEGTLRISVSSDFGRNIFLPWLDELMEQHPGLEVQLELGDKVSSLFRSNIDVALRYGMPQDSEAVAFSLGHLSRQLAASPLYLAREGTPTTPAELATHQCLLYKRADKTHDLWHFFSENEEHKVRVSGRRSCNDAEIARRWAVAGQGLVYKSRLDLAADLLDGRLVPLLPEYGTEPLELYLLCPGRAQVTPAVLALRDMLRTRVAERLAMLDKAMLDKTTLHKAMTGNALAGSAASDEGWG